MLPQLIDLNLKRLKDLYTSGKIRPINAFLTKKGEKYDSYNGV